MPGTYLPSSLIQLRRKTEMQAFLPLPLPMKIGEFRVLLVECGHYGAGRAVSVLAYNDLGHAGVFGLRLVVLVSIDDRRIGKTNNN